MLGSRSGSTRRLIQLCIGYFISYVATGVLVKVFTGGIRQPKMSEVAYLMNNTLGSSLLCVAVVLLFGWLGLKSARKVRVLGVEVPSEVRYIIPSGICTAVIIPATTMLYLLPISVMVAMVIMRGCVIIISRAVDAIQIRQGILRKKVYAEENWAVVFALLAVGSQIMLIPIMARLAAAGVDVSRFGINVKALAGSFDFVHHPLAMAILSSYVVAYSLRIYIMNFFKNTRARGVPLDNKGFFAYEQIAASLTMILGCLVFFLIAGVPGQADPRLLDFHAAVVAPSVPAILSGIPYGMVAFFSVFLFMFKGRTATFAGVVNRLVSLLAGTAATLLLFVFFRTSPPKLQDWASFLFILIAVWFLTRAEKLRTAEMVAAPEADAPVPARPAGG